MSLRGYYLGCRFEVAIFTRMQVCDTGMHPLTGSVMRRLNDMDKLIGIHVFQFLHNA